MLNTKTCPKCGGTEISHVDGVKSPVMKIKTGVSGNSTVSLVVCLTCGFCETWMESKVDRADLGRVYPPKK